MGSSSVRRRNFQIDVGGTLGNQKEFPVFLIQFLLLIFGPDVRSLT